MVNANGNINTKQLICNKAEERHWKNFKKDNRQREHRKIIYVSKNGVFKSEHNHLLCPPKYRHLIAMNRRLNDVDKTQADSLRCGYDKVNFTSKDLHNHISKTGRNKMKYGDVFTTLAYLLSKADNDPWSEIISKYGLAENEWVQGIYNDKMKWATAYLREDFFSRIRTTSQCEGIHLLLKNYINNKINLLEFMHKSSEDEIEAAGVLNVTECPNSRDLVEYNTISYDKDKDLFTYECRLFETRRLRCSHIFGIVKHRNAKCVPKSLILKRWIKIQRVILYAQLESKNLLMI
ncbi:hypothetical protein Ahy_A01g002935 [Arachis hypogaea]|uniref:Uncharacterized protein n=1 Tax=Arachis hypogaea TaxID=3818 RepID=A0A445ERT5_ARAHY|nr:hypothetical protein Ahy_A01g002935 [Arachis hypogaea]